MKVEYFQEHKSQLNARLETIELEKAQIVRKLKALDILLEENRPRDPIPMKQIVVQSVTTNRGTDSVVARKHSIPAHAVRFSNRISLIGAVEEIAKKQTGAFDSGVLLKALQTSYPEFNLGETKHISSPLSDLVKKGVLVIDRRRIGTRPNIYRLAPTAK
jgi:hypothetical protein